MNFFNEKKNILEHEITNYAEVSMKIMLLRYYFTTVCANFEVFSLGKISIYYVKYSCDVMKQIVDRTTCSRTRQLHLIQ